MDVIDLIGSVPVVTIDVVVVIIEKYSLIVRLNNIKIVIFRRRNL